MSQSPQTIEYGRYSRKSSEHEDRQVASIDAQNRELSGYTQRENLAVKRTLEESHSAKRPGRPVFNEVVRLLEQGDINGLLVWSCNRISRNAVDTGIIIDLMDRDKLLEVRTPTQTFRNTPNDKFLLTLFCSQAKLENDNKGLDVKRGLREKAQQGIYPAPAPLGYINDPMARPGNKTILPDPDRFNLCRKMVDLMLTGTHTPPRIWKLAQDEWGFRGPTGKPVSRSTIYNLFTRPFYYGEFEYPKGSGNRYKGIHKPLMTRVEYDRIQILLGRTSSKPKRHHHTFAYRGPLRCGACGAMITAEKKVKRQQNGNVHRYVYYHCTKRVDPTCKQPAIREKNLEKQVAQALSEIEIPTAFREWAVAELKRSNEQEKKGREALYSAQQRAYEGCVRKIGNLIDMRANDEITGEEFTAKKQTLLREKARYQELLRDTDKRLDDWLEIAESYLTFAEQAKVSFETGGIETRKRIFSALGSNLLLKDKKLLIDWDMLPIPLQSIARAVRAVHTRFEPEKTIATKRETRPDYTQNPTMLRLLDDVRTCIISHVATNRTIDYVPDLSVIKMEDVVESGKKLSKLFQGGTIMEKWELLTHLMSRLVLKNKK